MQDEVCSLFYIVFNCFQFISVHRSQLERNFNAVANAIPFNIHVYIVSY